MSVRYIIPGLVGAPLYFGISISIQTGFILIGCVCLNRKDCETKKKQRLATIVINSRHSRIGI